MAKVTAEQYAEKHARRLKQAIPDMEAGVQRVTISPTKQAAAKMDKLKANLNKAIDSGKMKRRMEAVSVEEWKEKMLSKGLNRVASGIDAAHAKQVTFANQLLPAVDAAVAKVKKMPDLTLEDSIQRVGSFIRDMAKFEKK